MCTTQQSRPREPTSPRSKYRLRMDTAPVISIECWSPAGTHRARAGGTTQVPDPLETVMTPALA